MQPTYIRLIRQQGTHPVGEVVRVRSIVPHGGNYDDACQYVLDDGTHVPESAAMTLEQLYPVTAEHMAVIRDPGATVRQKHDAAVWLIRNGMDLHELAPRTENMRAYYMVPMWKEG